ncbi:MAG: phosphoribosylformylglycinamidine synthase subunit PurL, partial [Cyanobacteria bacterium P01_C01_bin.118]
FASAELTDESEADRPAVQVGDPFLEKSLVEACLEAFKTGAVVAAQDMGAAGITCSTSEMAVNGGVGIELDLDKVPVRETGMVPYEYLLSESQERMLFVGEKGREQELINIFERWGLHAVVAGEVIEEPIVRILFQGEVAAEVPASALADNTPLYEREVLAEPPAYVRTAWTWQEASLPECDGAGINGKSWSEVMLALLGTPTIASKQWVYQQYDHQVQNNTVMLPGGADAAILRLRPLEEDDGASSNSGVAATTDCNPRYVYLNPYEGGLAAVAEAARNLSCVGAEPIAVTDNLNFGSPEKPVGYWQLAEACRGLADGCRDFDTPVTGGNVSLYNETVDSDGNPQPIYPTPVVGMVGVIDDLDRICGQSWRSAGDQIYLLGVPLGKRADSVTLGASEYLKVIYGLVAGHPPKVDVSLELKVQAACRHGIRQGWITAAHDCAEGGVAIALAESAIGGHLGAIITLPETDQRYDKLLFAEGGARIIVTVAPDCKAVWESYLIQQLDDQWSSIGTVTAADHPLTIQTTQSKSLIQLDVATMDDSWRYAIERALDA